MAGKKKKLSRWEQKQQKQRQKERVRRRTGWEESEAPEPNWQLFDDLRPFLSRPDLEKGLIALTELAADSEELIEEPEFRTLFFSPVDTLLLFAGAMDEGDLSPDDFWAMPEEARLEAVLEIMEQILPQLLTAEFRETLLVRAAAARARFRDEGDEKKLLVTSAVQFVLEMAEDEETDFYPGLVYMIASKSLDAGPLLIKPEDDEEFDEEEAEEQIEAIPGLREYLSELMRQAKVEFVQQLIDGEIWLRLFTDAEIEEATGLFEKGDGEQLDILADFLSRILSAQRRAEMAERLEAIFANLPDHWAENVTFLLQLQDDIPDLNPQTASWGVLMAALMGEINAYEADE